MNYPYEVLRDPENLVHLGWQGSSFEAPWFLFCERFVGHSVDYVEVVPNEAITCLRCLLKQRP